MPELNWLSNLIPKCALTSVSVLHTASNGAWEWATGNEAVWETGNEAVWATGNEAVWATGNETGWEPGNEVGWGTGNGLLGMRLQRIQSKGFLGTRQFYWSS